MGDGPHTTWNNEELSLTITGLTGGYSLQQLGQLQLLDYAQIQFPHDWDHFKVKATSHLIEWTWQANSWLIFDTTLSSGVEFTRRDGVGMSLQADEQLKTHLLQRPTISLDLTLTLRYNGSADHSGFHGSGEANAGLSLHF